MGESQSRLVCDLSALTAEQRTTRAALARQIFSLVRERRELPDGFEFRLEAGSDRAAIQQWAALEKRCCPFLEFTIDESDAGGVIWLRLSGADGAKDFLRSELG